jgi:pyruvate dehydrogenase E1 component beta subunit
VGAEVAALVAEHAFDALKVPVVRLTGPDAPAAASYPLEQAYAPQASDIEAATLALLRRNMAIA